MSTTAGPIVRGEGEGERRWFAGGGVHVMKATAEETDGAFILLENRMVQGKTTPLHTHPNLDETIIVLEGEILFYAEERASGWAAWCRGGSARRSARVHGHLRERANPRAADAWKRRGLLQGGKRAGYCRNRPG